MKTSVLSAIVAFTILASGAGAQEVQPRLLDRDAHLRLRKALAQVEAPAEVLVRIIVDSRGSVSIVDIRSEVSTEMRSHLASASQRMELLAGKARR